MFQLKIKDNLNWNENILPIFMKVRPATLCLQYDSLVTISNADKKESESQKMFSSSVRHNSTREDDTPVNLLIDELSDEVCLMSC